MDCWDNERKGAGRRFSVGVRSALASSLLTLALFLIMPFLELLSSPSGDSMRLVPAEAVNLPAAAPPPERIEQPMEERARPKPKPELRKLRRKLVPLAAAMNLDVSMGGIAGDFDLSFTVSGSGMPDIQGERVFSLADLDKAPQPVARLRPVYPPHARMKSLEGYVVMEFTVGPEGKTRDLRAISSMPEGVFNRAAEMAVRRWRFRPGTKDGKAVPVRMRQKIRFELVE